MIREASIKTLTWQQVLHGYSQGIFPMGEDDDSINWYEANPRAIIPLDKNENGLHISRSLSQTLRKKLFTVKYDTSFEKVIDYCSEIRFSTWINRLIRKAYVDLFKYGYAHSVEAWDGDTLAGGLYGVAFKGAFFGESMFYIKDNASKVTVVNLYDTLKRNKYLLFDIQMATPVFEKFGAVHISKDTYMSLLNIAMKTERKFTIS